MAYWLKSFGTAEDPLDPEWLEPHADILTGFACPDVGRPSFEVGDQVVWYAAGHKVFFGLAVVTREAEEEIVHEWQRDRWPWYVKTEARLLIPDLRIAPTLTDAKIWTLSVRSHSHIRLDGEQYWHAAMSLLGVAMAPVLERV